MSGFIVDFPTERISSSSPIEMEGGKRKAVRFSSTIDLRHFEPHDEIDKAEIWYANEDYVAMRRENNRRVQEAHRIHFMISGKTDSTNITAEMLDSNLCGIENLLTPRISIERR